MTRNFVPLHVFLRHETEWQSIRAATAETEEFQAAEKPALTRAAASAEAASVKRGASSSAHSA